MNIAKAFKHTGVLLRRNSPTILTGLGVAGAFTATILAVKATPGATEKLDQAYLIKNGAENFSDLENLPASTLTPWEVVKVAWKDYLPAAGVLVITTTCIIGAQRINVRRQAALISMVTVSESALREYQERMVAEVPAKDRKVRDDIARDKLAKNPPDNREIILIGDGDQLFYEERTDRYFKSTKNKVDKAVNDLNFRIHNQDYAAVNDFYTLLGLKRVSTGDEFGWTQETPLEIDFSTHITEDGQAAIVITYVRNPEANYWKGFR